MFENANDNWDDFDAMLQDMKQYALNNGQVIEMADRPMQLRWAWKCKNTGKSWSIKISTLKEYIQSLDQKKQATFSKILSSQEGKQGLLNIINGK